MKRIEAYQTSDGKGFLGKPEAQSHEDRLRYKTKVEEIENYLYNLLGIEPPNKDEDGEGQEERLCDILKEGSVSDLCNGLIAEAAELGGIGEIVDFIIDIATISDGALLKTAQYAKEIISEQKKEVE